MTDGSNLRVWALLGPHRGDNNQVLCLARALGLPFEEKVLSYNRLRSLQPAILGATFRTLAPESRRSVGGDPPDLTISTGHRSVPVVRELRRRSGGRTRSVHLGYPRISPEHFDLVVPTPEYPVPDGPNVMRIPLALTPHSGRARLQAADMTTVEHLPQPRRLFLLGGPTLYWQLGNDSIVDALRRLLDSARSDGGSVMVVGSPRTPPRLLDLVGGILAETNGPHLLAPIEGPPTYRALLKAANLIFVTADSVAMVSDAIYTGKPVGLVPIEKSGLGRAAFSLNDWLRPGRRIHPRDLRFFWAALRREDFTGTLAQPRASAAPNYAALVAERVTQLLEDFQPQATNARDSVRRAQENPA